MKRRLTIATMALCITALFGAGCLDEKTIEIVITGETSADFAQNETSASWAEGTILDMGAEIRDILESNGYGSEDLKSAHVTSVSYGVLSFAQAHDWQITGAITVSYDGATETIVNYASQSVQDALGRKIPAPLEPAGVALINRALQDFLDGVDPLLALTIENGSTAPVPSVEDPMVFDWRAWLAVQVIVVESVEVPDPF